LTIGHRDNPAINGPGAVAGEEDAFPIRRPAKDSVISFVLDERDFLSSVNPKQEYIEILGGFGGKTIIHDISAVGRQPSLPGVEPVQSFQDTEGASFGSNLDDLLN
jgi:hypothetical protein